MGLPLTVTDLRVRLAGRDILAVDAFEAPAGALIGIAGPSGAGKSTLLYALAGLVGASGQVRWGDTDLLSLSPRRRARFRRSHVGLVFQDFLLFEELGAAANASIGAAFADRSERAAIRRRAAGRLADLGVPEGRRAAATYSGGERQRIALARALAGEPSTILADEPTASLDAAAKTRLIDDLVQSARAGGKTLIAVSHDAALLAAMDRTLILADGRIAAAPRRAVPERLADA